MFTCTLRTTLLALGICPVSDVQCVSVSRVYATPRSVSSDSSRSGQARVRAEARPGERERPPVGSEAVKPADWSQTQLLVRTIATQTSIQSLQRVFVEE